MADKQTSGQAKGLGHPGDQTAMPGQAQGHLPYGNQTLSTGLAGTTPDTSGPQDNTTVPGQNPDSVFGVSNPHGTGLDGSAGATEGVSGGATYTDPFAIIGGGTKGDASGGSTDTEGQANKYGSSSMVGIAGSGQPTSTGVDKGRLLIGGNSVG